MPIDDNDENRSTPQWILLVCGIVMIVIRFHLHGVFTDLEKSGGSICINWFVAGLYKLLGKWGVVGPTGLIAMGMCWRAFVPGKSQE